MQRVKPYIDSMIQEFNGVSATKIVGCYYSDDKKGVQCEDGYRLTSVVDEKDSDIIRGHYRFILKLAGRARRDFGQESILTQHNIVADNKFTSGRKRFALPLRKVGKDVINEFLKKFIYTPFKCRLFFVSKTTNMIWHIVIPLNLAQNALIALDALFTYSFCFHLLSPCYYSSFQKLLNIQVCKFCRAF